MAIFIVVGALAFSTSSADAARSRALTGLSIGRDGSAGTERFSPYLSDVAVDQATGDIYVYDAEPFNRHIFKFDSAGDPVSFSSTGTNSIPIRQQTISSEARKAQIAIAPTDSIGETAGDIYFASYYEGEPAVTVFASSGVELGAFGPKGGDSGKEACGVATDSSGNVIIATGRGATLSEYAPSSNPPKDTDFVQEGFKSGTTSGLCNLAIDGGGEIYASFESNNPDFNSYEPIFRFSGVDDPSPSQLDFTPPPSSGITGFVTLTADPRTGVLYVDGQSEVAEFASGGGQKLATFAAGQISGSLGIAVNATTDTVYAADPSTGLVKVFGSPVVVPTVAATGVSPITPVEVEVGGLVTPEGNPITSCFVEYGLAGQDLAQKGNCSTLPPNISESHSVSITLAGLSPNQVYQYRLIAENANGTGSSPVQTFVTDSTVQTKTPKEVTETTATLTGRVFPNGKKLVSCEFEYQLASEPDSSLTKACSPPAEQVPDDSVYHSVTAKVDGLSKNNAAYRVRLRVSTEDETVEGAWIMFSTSGEPVISEVRAADADQHSVTLEADVDPAGFLTSYLVEWGSDATYGSVAVSGSLDPSSKTARIAARIGDLAEGTVYHYRIRAVNGSADSPINVTEDQTFETLNHCGLLQDRCFELTSERDSGPVASPGHGIPFLEKELKTQAAERDGALAYVSEGGYRDATRGGSVLYKALRGPVGWVSDQLSPSVTARDEQGIEESSNSSRILALSPELSCGVVEATQPIPGTTPQMREILEAGGANLYRLNSDGSYTPITTLPPIEPLPSESEIQGLGGLGYFTFAGMARDCSQIYFASSYDYPGSQSTGRYPLYRWSEGDLRAVGFVPADGGEVAAVALPGNDSGYVGGRADRNAVSANGNRIFFTAKRADAVTAGEEGLPGLFVREGGASTRDVSASETTIPDTNPAYQWATPDGAQVFFTGPTGLTDDANAEGTDLYVYDLRSSTAGHPLRDLSVNPIGGEAAVAGMMGASEDGSRVYFAATARLVAGQGPTARENIEAETYSIYLVDRNGLRFVASVGKSSGLLLDNSSTVTSQVSSDGRYLLFEGKSSAGGPESPLLPQVYLFDAGARKEPLSCVSCMPGGRAPARGNLFQLLAGPGQASPEAGALPPPRSLFVTTAGPSVVFSSLDSLAPGATEGQVNIFEWSHGQVSLLAAEPSGLLSKLEPENILYRNVLSLGSSMEGTDIYLATPQTLTWEDGDARSSVYDARVGGGFSPKSAHPAACDPTIEGQCQYPQSTPPELSAPKTPSFIGPGNHRPTRCQKVRAKKHRQCHRGTRHRNKRHRKSRKRHVKSGHKQSTKSRRAFK